MIVHCVSLMLAFCLCVLFTVCSCDVCLFLCLFASLLMMFARICVCVLCFLIVCLMSAFFFFFFWGGGEGC